MAGMATTKVTTSSFTTGTIQHPTQAQQATAAATTSSTLGNPNNLVSVRGPRPISGENDPPPSYRESFRAR